MQRCSGGQRPTDQLVRARWPPASRSRSISPCNTDAMAPAIPQPLRSTIRSTLAIFSTYLSAAQVTETGTVTNEAVDGGGSGDDPETDLDVQTIAGLAREQNHRLSYGVAGRSADRRHLQPGTDRRQATAVTRRLAAVNRATFPSPTRRTRLQSKAPPKASSFRHRAAIREATNATVLKA